MKSYSLSRIAVPHESPHDAFLSFSNISFKADEIKSDQTTPSTNSFKFDFCLFDH